jgi:mono/diheme cytochrome c family protein
MYEVLEASNLGPVSRPAFALLLVLVLLGAGCARSPRPRSAETGAAVFAQSCLACHTLIGNESGHKQGGDLLGYRMSRATLTSFTRVMPVRRALSRAQLRAVVTYVLRAERGASVPR